jgi:hypothetical protein
VIASDSQAVMSILEVLDFQDAFKNVKGWEGHIRMEVNCFEGDDGQ